MDQFETTSKQRGGISSALEQWKKVLGVTRQSVSRLSQSNRQVLGRTALNLQHTDLDPKSTGDGIVVFDRISERVEYLAQVLW